MASEEGISSNILADRLRLLQDARIVERHQNKSNALMIDYHITQKGKDLVPAIKELVNWSLKYVSGPLTPPENLIEEFRNLANP